jgi:hypothetical protein
MNSPSESERVFSVTHANQKRVEKKKTNNNRSKNRY